MYADDSIESTLPGYIINPESTFSKVQNVGLQLITWINLIITPVGFVFADEIGESLHFCEWVVDIAWTVEILMNFFTADYKNRTFRQISADYLKFWFWVDSLSTFPAMVLLQQNRYVNLLKFGRILHFYELFVPFRVGLEFCMRDAIRKRIDNTYSLIKLFTSAVLLAHFSACAWIYLGKRNASSWVNVLENGVEDSDGNFQDADD